MTEPRGSRDKSHGPPALQAATTTDTAQTTTTARVGRKHRPNRTVGETSLDETTSPAHTAGATGNKPSKMAASTASDFRRDDARSRDARDRVTLPRTADSSAARGAATSGQHAQTTGRTSTVKHKVPDLPHNATKDRPANAIAGQTGANKSKTSDGKKSRAQCTTSKETNTVYEC